MEAELALLQQQLDDMKQQQELLSRCAAAHQGLQQCPRVALSLCACCCCMWCAYVLRRCRHASPTTSCMAVTRRAVCIRAAADCHTHQR
jgi:hypothetical protein